MDIGIKKLNIITYLVPDVAVEIFQMYAEYIEKRLDIRCNLIYESRWKYPPKERDHFALGDADMGFINTNGFLQISGPKSSIELCPVATVYTHPCANGRPLLFSDVIIRSGAGHDYNDLEQLKGHKCVFANPSSTTSYFVMLNELKNRNTDASFFADMIQSGSNFNSIQLILTKRADVGAIDSRYLKNFFNQHPHYRQELKVITTLGPMPENPIVFRKTLPSETKEIIKNALLQMPKDSSWQNRLQELDIENVVEVDSSFFGMERILQEKMPKDLMWHDRLAEVDIEDVVTIDSTFFNMEKYLQKGVKKMLPSPIYY